MSPTMTTALLLATLFAGLLGSIELGRHIGKRPNQGGTPDLTGAGLIEGAVFSLLGLLLAFSFQGAADRFEVRRHLITEEANDIGTAYLRIDILAPRSQPEMRVLFEKYLAARIDAFKSDGHGVAVDSRLVLHSDLQSQIWTKATIAIRDADAATQAGTLLLPALNQMFDVATTRMMAARNHPPFVVNVMLVLFSIAGALLAGYCMSGSRGRSWVHALVFAVMMSATVFMAIDLEYPRRGLIRIDADDQLLVDLLADMRGARTSAE